MNSDNTLDQTRGREVPWSKQQGVMNSGDTLDQTSGCEVPYLLLCKNGDIYVICCLCHVSAPAEPRPCLLFFFNTCSNLISMLQPHLGQKNIIHICNLIGNNILNSMVLLKFPLEVILFQYGSHFSISRSIEGAKMHPKDWEPNERSSQSKLDILDPKAWSKFPFGHVYLSALTKANY